MAIDAVITGVTVVAPGRCKTCNRTGKDPNFPRIDCPTCDGHSESTPRVRLTLEPREQGGVVGQPTLTIVDPPTTNPKMLAGMIGTEVWGGDGYLMVGDRKWADRISWTKIRLVK